MHDKIRLLRDFEAVAERALDRSFPVAVSIGAAIALALSSFVG